MRTNTRTTLQHLAQQINDIAPNTLTTTANNTPTTALPTLIPTNTSIPSLPRAAIHEIVGPALPASIAQTPTPHLPRQRHAPTALLVSLARHALRTTNRHTLVWIGEPVIPHGHALAPHPNTPADHPNLLERSIFITPPSHADRLWAAEIALRCPAVAAVILHAAGLSLTETRRLQLAAESTRPTRNPTPADGGLAILARPPSEHATPSAALTRWLIRTAPHPNAHNPRWTAEPLRCKGLPPESVRHNNAETFEWNREKHCVPVPADIPHRPRKATTRQRSQHTREHAPQHTHPPLAS